MRIFENHIINMQFRYIIRSFIEIVNEILAKKTEFIITL